MNSVSLILVVKLDKLDIGNCEDFNFIDILSCPLEKGAFKQVFNNKSHWFIIRHAVSIASSWFCAVQYNSGVILARIDCPDIYGLMYKYTCVLNFYRYENTIGNDKFLL